ncbi:MAG TPA: YIP1 family protein [Ktedonobacteraceae bacterium]|nr:YIP1 family protein [Ktedonobacteraceae bacterium]
MDMERQAPRGYTDGKLTTERPEKMSVWRLPWAYSKVLFAPSVSRFAGEARYARWGLVWFQILILLVAVAIAGAIVGFLRTTEYLGAIFGLRIVTAFLSLFSVSTSVVLTVAQLIFIPLSFFFVMGIQYIFARAFGGRGSLLAQTYTNLLYYVPLTIIGKILAVLLVFFPIVGVFTTFFIRTGINLLLLAYGVVLSVLLLMGVHRLKRDRAIGVIIWQIIVVVVVVVALIVFVGILLDKNLRPAVG